MLSASTRERGDRSATRRVASMPFNSGMATSMTITSGCNWPARSRASRPLPASPTISMSGCAARIILNPCRTTAWSSANKMWIFSLMLCAAGRHADFDFDAPPRVGAHAQVATHAARAGPHSDHTHAARSSASGRQAAPVVANGKAHLAALPVQLHNGVACAGMPRHIGERLLRQAEQVRFGIVGQASGNSGLEFRLDSSAMREAFAEPAQRGFQAKIVKNCGTQQLRHLPYIADGFVHQSQAVVQTRWIDRAYRLPIGAEGRQIGLDGCQRLPEFVV